MAETRITVDYTAVNALLDELKMSSKDATAAVRSALRDSVNIIRKSVRAGVAKISGDRQKQRGVQVKIYKNASGAQVNIYNAFYIERDGRKSVFILRWLEEGTKGGPIQKGKTRKDSKPRMHGATPAKPFFNSSVQAARPQAEAALSDAILKRIRKVAEKRNNTR